MKKIRNFKAKNLLAILLSLLLVTATALGILTATRKSVHAATIPIIEKYMYRDRLMTITDMGPLLNEYDEFDCANELPSIGTLIDSGYRYVTVDINFEMREIDDGWQDAYIYNSVEESDAHLLNRIIFDYGTNKLVSTWGLVIINFKSLPLYDFLDKDFNMGLVIRYDGHGRDNDTWQNKNWTMRVTLSQTAIREKNSVSGSNVVIG